MFRELLNEEWKEIQHDEYYSKKAKIFISNYGRLKWFDPITKKDKLKKPSIANNFYVSYFPRENKKVKSFYVHKMVGELFLEKEEENQKFVIHLDHDLKNNHVSNLQHVTREKLSKHQKTNPKVSAPKKKRVITGRKLTETKVKLIKRKINDPNRRTRLRIIAKQFGISEMQLHRIKTGENWGHVSEK